MANENKPKYYSTSVSALKSMMQIEEYLVKAGARNISKDFDKDGNAVGIVFMMMFDDIHPVRFKIECNFEGTLKRLESAKIEKKYKTKEQALKVGWRKLSEWVVFQVEMVEDGLLSMASAFLSGAVMKDGKTFLEALNDNPEVLLIQK